MLTNGKKRTPIRKVYLNGALHYIGIFRDNPPGIVTLVYRGRYPYVGTAISHYYPR